MARTKTPAHRHYKVWLDGAIVAPEDAKISIFTQTAMRGANVYEGIRAYWSNGAMRIWKLDRHIKRLFESMKIMHMTSPYTADEYRQAAIDWVAANGFREDVHFRLVVYFGDAGTGGTTAYRPEDVGFGAWVAGGGGRDDKAVREGIGVCVSSWRRINDDAMPPRVKAGANYQNSRLAGIEAKERGFDDALLLTRDGKLAESTGAGVMMVRNGELVTPPVTDGILESITRATLLEMWQRRSNRPGIERAVDRTELYVADEVFLCGTGKEVTPVVAVDGVSVGTGSPGPVTRELQAALWAAARSEDPDYADQLTTVP